jgi:hypothetical protein
MKMNEIKTGDLLYWEKKGVYAWIIRHLTGYAQTHVAVALVLEGIPFYVEAEDKVGVRMVNILTNSPKWCQHTDATVSVEARAWLLAQLTVPYSMLNAAEAGLGKKPKEYGWQCAELATAFLRKCGWSKYLPTAPTPGNLAEEVETDTGHPLVMLEA